MWCPTSLTLTHTTRTCERSYLKCCTNMGFLLEPSQLLSNWPRSKNSCYNFQTVLLKIAKFNLFALASNYKYNCCFIYCETHESEASMNLSHSLVYYLLPFTLHLYYHILSEVGTQVYPLHSVTICTFVLKIK